MISDKKYEEGIYWTVWQLVDGCTKVSEACKNCWSEAMAKRFKKFLDIPNDEGYFYSYKKGNSVFHGTFNWQGKILLRHNNIDLPLRRKKPTIFSVWNDCFHENVNAEFQMRTINIAAQCKQHTFLILTKRPERMRIFFTEYYKVLDKIPEKFKSKMPYDNLWLGVTCENQRTADERIPILLQIPAAHRFVSLEPLLEKIELYDEWNAENLLFKYTGGQTMPNTVHGPAEYDKWPEDSIDWVVVGAETGPKARYCPLEWIESVVRQCQAAGVPVWVKAVHIGTAKKFKQVRKYNELPESVRVRQFPFKERTGEANGVKE